MDGNTRAMSKGLGGQNELNEGLRQASRVNDVKKIRDLLSKNADVNCCYVRLRNTSFFCKPQSHVR